MVDQPKVCSLISSRDRRQRFLQSQIFDIPRAGFEPAQNLISGFAESSYAVTLTVTPGHMSLSRKLHFR